MADQKLSDLTSIPSVDRATGLLYIVDAPGNAYYKVTPNSLLGITGDPVGHTDTQTLSNKTITAPTISSPVLSGTITGTYTIGGTPTFPSSVVTLTGAQTLTNKILTSPTINTPTINNPSLNTDAINEFTAANGVNIDGLSIKDSKLNTNDSVVTANITNSAVTYAKVATGFPVQVVSTTSSAFSSGTTIIPLDDTIPQITEGDEYMTLAITPKSSTNTLVIQVVAALANATAGGNMQGAIFQDSTANALAATSVRFVGASDSMVLPLTHSMTAGTTSATTFRFRAGTNVGGTTTFNGRAGSRLFGAITKSTIVITEIKA